MNIKNAIFLIAFAYHGVTAAEEVYICRGSSEIINGKNKEVIEEDVRTYEIDYLKSSSNCKFSSKIIYCEFKNKFPQQDNKQDGHISTKIRINPFTLLITEISQLKGKNSLTYVSFKGLCSVDMQEINNGQDDTTE